MRWIGITGDIGSGKSTVSNFLRQKGYGVLEADRVVHDLYELDQSLIAKIKKVFGDHVEKEGEIQRDLLMKEIQKQKDGLQTIENIVHPKVREYVQRWKECHKDHDLLFYEVPLLFEKSLEQEFDAVLYIHADRDLTKERLKKRNRWTEHEIKIRQKWLLNPAQKKEKSTFVIENHGNEEELKKEIDKFLSLLTKSKQD